MVVVKINPWDEYDMLCKMCNVRKENPMNNAQYLFESHERFNEFFSLAAKADYQGLKEKFGLEVIGDFHESFNKWLVKERKNND